MAEISKPDYRYVWSSGGANVSPSNTKIQTGWTSEVPPYQWENYLQNRQDNMLVHINQHGIPQWDALTEYFANKSYTLGSDGLVYKAVQNSGPNTTTQDPTTDVSDTYWRVAFADASQNYITQTTGDARYLQRSNNLSDLTDPNTARTNLGVFFDSVRVDVASASTVNLTTSSPSSRHVNITGTTTINNFTVIAGRCYFVRFDAALTLTNSASLVTQSGANITTAAGDTCVIRATAANVVEVLCYTTGIPQAIGYGQTWQAFPGPARLPATTYTNTTGRPIKVKANSSIPSGGNIQLLISGVQVDFFSNPSGTTGTFSVGDVVPAGSTYRIERTGSSTMFFFELRV